MRSKRAYEEIGSTQRWERRKQARAALERIGVPATAVCEHRPTTAAILSLTTATRRKIRTIPSLCIPGEKRSAACKKLLAHTHGTATQHSKTSFLTRWSPFLLAS